MFSSAAAHRFRRTPAYEVMLWLRRPESARNRLRERRFYHPLLAHLERPLIFDVGASAGAKAEIFARYGRVVCVEPSPASAEALRARFAGLPGIAIVEAAAGATEGTATFWEFEPGSAYNTISEKWAAALTDEGSNRFGMKQAQPQSQQVAMVTVDSLIDRFGTPAYLKIDAEGFEWPVLQGLNRRCSLVSAEFNLPEFQSELHDSVARLTGLLPDALFNAAITEPPIAFEWPDWKPGPAALETIAAAGWRYVELFCRDRSRA